MCFRKASLGNGRERSLAFASRPLTPTLFPEYRGEGVIFRRCLTTCVVSIAWLLTPTAFAAALILYVAPDGNDGWSGRLPEANAQRSDGPLATPHVARDTIRRWRKSEPEGAGPVTVILSTTRSAAD